MTSPLSPVEARRTLEPLGRLLYDVQPRTMWERDTRTLPRHLVRARRRYRAFAEQQLAPRELLADRHGEHVDVRPLFLDAARQGFQTELLPRPLGTGSARLLLGGVLWPAVLKAEEFAAGDAGLGLALLAHDLGMVPLLLSGDLAAMFRWQRRIYREIRAGEPAIAAFAITEPGAGSDVEETEGAASACLVTRARKAPGGWRLSGRKCFISNGRVARWVTVFAALEQEGLESWTCFLVDSSMQGFGVGRSERKLGQRAADASELILDDVFVPDDRVIGGLRSGWALNRNVLNYSRPAVGAIGVGIARSAFEHAVRFCRATRLANRSLLSYQDVQLRLASMLSRIQAARATVWQTARYGRPCQAAAAAGKAFCAEVAWDVSTQAMELLGDPGYLHTHAVEKAMRDARLTLLYEGTHQINLLAVFEGQQGAEFAQV